MSIAITPDYNPTGALKGIPILLMNAQTVDETKSTVVCPGHGIRNHSFIIRVSANVTGKVTWEEAPDPAYTGIWSPLAAEVDLSTIGAAGILITVISNRMIVAARGRISVVVAGGTVSLEYVGQ